MEVHIKITDALRNAALAMLDAREELRLQSLDDVSILVHLRSEQDRDRWIKQLLLVASSSPQFIEKAIGRYRPLVEKCRHHLKTSRKDAPNPGRKLIYQSLVLILNQKCRLKRLVKEPVQNFRAIYVLLLEFHQACEDLQTQADKVFKGVYLRPIPAIDCSLLSDNGVGVAYNTLFGGPIQQIIDQISNGTVWRFPTAAGDLLSEHLIYKCRQTRPSHRYSP